MVTAAKRSRINAIAIAELMIGLQDACHTMYELADMSGLAIQTVRGYCNTLHRRGIVHVADWSEDARGARTLKVFALGSGVDMPKPKPQPKTEGCRRWREKQRQQKLLHMMAANTSAYKVAA
jgi:hypothetical protein